MEEIKKGTRNQEGLLTEEQDALLDLYLQTLDRYYENLKAAEKVQVEIETLHLKKILTK